MVKTVKVEDAVGLRLAHDITKVDIENRFKGVAFKKGHKIREEDVKHLKALGKEEIYVLELGEDEIHEDEASILLADAIMGENTYRDKEPSEGKINIYAKTFGVLKVDREKLFKINMLEIPSCRTIFGDIYVEEGQKLASVRIIPLYTKKDIIDTALKIIGDKGIVKVVPFIEKKAGLIITGNEVYYGRIKDKFYDKLKPKLSFFKVNIEEKVILPDDENKIRNKIKEFIEKYDIVLLTGGTSVDPDDRTYKALKSLNPENYIRANPIEPGNMLTFGWINNKPIIAIPTSALYYRATSFDVWLPLILIGEKPTKEEVARKGYGGLCFFCKVCVFPVCPFGKGY